MHEDNKSDKRKNFQGLKERRSFLTSPFVHGQASEEAPRAKAVDPSCSCARAEVVATSMIVSSFHLNTDCILPLFYWFRVVDVPPSTLPNCSIS